MSSRFSNITEQYKEPSAFLAKIEKLNDKMEVCYRGIDEHKENSIAGRIQKVFRRDPYTRLEAYKNEWHKVTGQLHPFISDKDGKPAYLSSFLEENRLRSHINSDFYHIPESQISSAYSYYESDCTLGHSWVVKRDAATKLEQILPEKAELWTHCCHSGARDIAENGIAINTVEDAGRINLERNLSHYGDMGHVMVAMNVGSGYKHATNVFLCDIESEDKAKFSVEESQPGYACSCNLSPEHICAVLTIEGGKITDACTRDEFLDKFRENEVDAPWREPGYEPELEQGLDLDLGSGYMDRMEYSMAMGEEDLER